MNTTRQIQLILPGSIRSKKNSKQAIMIGGKNCPRRPMIIPSKAYQVWETEARKEVMLKLPFAFKPIHGPVHVTAMIYFSGPRPDLSGCLESVGDCLQGLVWEDDGQIESWDGSRVIHDKANPRTVVEIRELDVMPLFSRGRS